MSANDIRAYWESLTGEKPEDGACVSETPAATPDAASLYSKWQALRRSQEKISQDADDPYRQKTRRRDE